MKPVPSRSATAPPTMKPRRLDAGDCVNAGAFERSGEAMNGSPESLCVANQGRNIPEHDAGLWIIGMVRISSFRSTFSPLIGVSPT